MTVRVARAWERDIAPSVYGAHDEEHNQAVVLAAVIGERAAPRPGPDVTRHAG
jgi:hypothetical protein